MPIYQGAKYHITGLIELYNNNFIKAIEAFSLATKLEPENSSHWSVLGAIHMKIGNSFDALKAFETILFHYPNNIIALINSYDILTYLGDLNAKLPSDLEFINHEKEKKSIDLNNIWYEQAKKRLNKAISLEPTNYQVIKRQKQLIQSSL